jgi:opacity protein-like surface antigen
MGGEWMMGKFASVTATVLTMLVLTIVLGAQGFCQTTPAEPAPATAPAEQQPAAQNPATPPPAAQQPDSGQEPVDVDSTSRRRKEHPHDFKNWNFNVGAGANVVSGTTLEFVRNGGFVGTVGAARNANKYLGLRADFAFANLPLRDSTQQLALAAGASNHAYAFTIDPIINIPVTSLYGGYILFGPAFFHRSGHLNSDTTVPGSACNSFWTWWGACSNTSVPLSNSFANSSQNEFGYDFGGGVTRKMPSGVEIYAEYRINHGARNGVTTDFHPITIGVRW